MCKAVCVLFFVVCSVGMAQCWDFVVSQEEKLVFYTNGIKTRTINLTSQNPTALAYDEIRQTILYIDKRNEDDTICGCSLSTEDYKCFIKRNGRDIPGFAFDPVTATIFFTDKYERSINYIPLKPGYNDNVYGNLLFEVNGQGIPTDIAVDSCHGYIYWITVKFSDFWEISRCRFNGTDRQVFSKKYFKLFSLTIDPQIQKMLYFGYYSDRNIRMVSSRYLTRNELRGIHDNILLKYSSVDLTKVLTTSKDYIYFTKRNSLSNYDTVWQIPKNATLYEPKEITKLDYETSFGIVANYKIVDQINGVQGCDSLSRLIATTTVASGNTSVRTSTSLIATTTVASGNTSDRTNASLCDHYCLRGNCSFNDDGLPTCSCDAGYSGNKCQVNLCHGYCPNNGSCSLNEKNEPICQYKGQFEGDRYEVSPCMNYCFQGNCSVNDDGLPHCSCNAGYSGDRCEVNACRGYCLNNGDCSLNEKEEPVCQCDSNHKGSRCEADISTVIPEYDAVKRNQTLADLFSIWRKSSSKMYLTVEI
ncbi:hypothetical protein PYW07_008688 [Mythimna separata]|uniref:EGF-like domain-containing protein n=1 Tax=Mythimna separata TaxID=271217 RepID=A0AAD7YDK5_MYTSE|nr:hypothetical protein PYW07_008688 [Mythimna separata]